MYTTPDEQTQTLEPQVAELEESIQAMLKVIGPTREERKLFFRPIDILTTPAEFWLMVQQLDAVKQQVNAAAGNLAAAKNIAVRIQG
jgi:hypothetical protein